VAALEQQAVAPGDRAAQHHLPDAGGKLREWRDGGR
jgi:hypothetical protein